MNEKAQALPGWSKIELVGFHTDLKSCILSVNQIINIDKIVAQVIAGLFW